MDLQQDKFGFALMKSRELSLDEDRLKGYRDYLAEYEPSALKCIQCGSCAASCTTASSGTNLRNAVHHFMRGCIQESLQMTSYCLLCGKCRFICPRGVNGRNVLAAIYGYSQNQLSSPKSMPL